MVGSLPVVPLTVLGVTVTGGLLGVGLAAYAWNNRDVPGATAYAALVATEGVWCLAYAGVLASPSLSVALVFDRVVAGASLAGAALWLVFVLSYTGHDEWLTRRRLALVFAQPALYYLAFLTNPWTGLFRTDVHRESFGGLTLVASTPTALLWAQIGVIYLAVLLGLGLLLRFTFQTHNVYRRQTATILVGNTLVIVGNVVFVAGLSPHEHLDVTPLFFVAGAIVIALALFEYDFLSLDPVAADVLVDEMDDPVVVVDEDDVVADYNRAARSVLAVPAEDAIGTPVATAVPGLVDALAGDGDYVAPAGGSGDDGDGSTDGGADVGGETVYDVNVTPYRDQHGIVRGRVVALRDVTVARRRETAMAGLQTASRRLMSERSAADIAAVAVETADEVLDYRYAGVLLVDDDGERMRSAALSAELDRALGDEAMTVTDHDSPIWGVYETGEPLVSGADDPGQTGSYDHLPFDGLYVLPLGEHGVFGIGSVGRDPGSADERQFLEVLASATETALDRAERERELRESRTALRQRNEQIEFFNGLLRHDILNGMTVVQGHLDLLEPHVEEPGRDHYETVDAYAEDIAELTERVRYVSNVLAASEREPRSVVDLSAAVRDRAAKVSRAHPEVRLAVDVADGLEVQANELLGEVVENVVQNAIEHSDRDAPQVAVTTRVTDDDVEVRVADDGPGIPDDRKEQVFEREVTAMGADSVGFGLYFVDRMMDRLGGEVWVEDNDPRGAVVVLAFERA